MAGEGVFIAVFVMVAKAERVAVKVWLAESDVDAARLSEPSVRVSVRLSEKERLACCVMESLRDKARLGECEGWCVADTLRVPQPSPAILVLKGRYSRYVSVPVECPSTAPMTTF